MRKFSSIKSRINLLVALGVVALAVTSVISISGFRELRVGGPRYAQIAQNNLLLADVLPPPLYIIEADLVASQMTDATDAKDTARIAELARTFDKLRGDYRDRSIYWQTTLTAGTTKDLVAQADEGAQKFFAAYDKSFKPAVEQGDGVTARQVLLNEMDLAYREHRAVVDQIAARTISEAKVVEDSSLSAADTQMKLLLALAVGVALITLIIGTVVNRAIAKRISLLEDTMTRCGEGDLRLRFELDRADEVADIGASFNTMLDRIVGSFRHVETASSSLVEEAANLASLSGGLAATAADTEARTASAAHHSHEVATAIDELATSAREFSIAIAEVAKATSGVASVSSAAVDATSNAEEVMGSLQENSNEIARVAEAINEIADKTNLLALNATIEAMRAGEHGKGFAVVAGEVKELSRATSEATQNIADRLATISSSVIEMGLALEAIRETIGRLDHEQAVIAAATEEQSATTQTITATVDSAARSTVEVHDGVASAATAAEEASLGASSTREAAGRVAGTAEELRRLVGQFQL